LRSEHNATTFNNLIGLFTHVQHHAILWFKIPTLCITPGVPSFFNVTSQEFWDTLALICCIESKPCSLLWWLWCFFQRETCFVLPHLRLPKWSLRCYYRLVIILFGKRLKESLLLWSLFQSQYLWNIIITDLRMHGVWEPQVDAIIDVHILLVLIFLLWLLSSQLPKFRKEERVLLLVRHNLLHYLTSPISQPDDAWKRNLPHC